MAASIPTIVPVASDCENPTSYAPPRVLGLAAPDSMLVAGEVLRLTVACRRRVGSKLRYNVSIKYCDDIGDNLLTPMSRLFCRIRLIKSPIVSGNCPLRMSCASSCGGAAEGDGGNATVEGR